MEKEISIDGMKAKVDEKFYDAFMSMKKDMDKMKKDMGMMKEKKKDSEIETLNEEIKELTKANDTLEAKKDSLELEIQTLKENAKTPKLDADQIDSMVEERENVVATAKEIIGSEFKKDGLSNLEIKKQVVSKISPDLKLDEKSEDYIDARFEMISENTSVYGDKLKAALESKAKNDGEENKNKPLSADEARKRMIADSANAYTKPLTKSKAK